MTYWKEIEAICEKKQSKVIMLGTYANDLVSVIEAKEKLEKLGLPHSHLEPIIRWINSQIKELSEHLDEDWVK